MTAREVIERYVAAYVSGDTSGLPAIIAAGFVDHTFPAFSGIDGVARGIARLHAGLSEISCVVEHCVIEGDRAAFFAVASGRHTGVLAERPPTGNRVTWTIADFVRLEGGKLVELWSVQDTLAYIEGLGGAKRA
jgi:predicted ester cyclase